MWTELKNPRFAIPLSVLDFSPIAEGEDSTAALRHSIQLAQITEALGFSRYWLGEHHVASGVAGVAPHTFAGIVAAHTKSIRIGTAATILPHHFPAQIIEFAGVLSAIYDRLDLGLARGHAANAVERSAALTTVREDRIRNGIVFPYPRKAITGTHGYSDADLQSLSSNRESVDFEREAAVIADTFRTHASGRTERRDPNLPFSFDGLSLWIHGTNPGESPRLAGRLGLPYSANYHFSGGQLLENIAVYRESFLPVGALTKPYVMVSADVIAAETQPQAESIREAYALRSLKLKQGNGLTPLASPETLRNHRWSDDERATIEDKLLTQFVGTGAEVAHKLRALAEIAGADELLITSVAYRFVDRVRSYSLIASEWQ